MIFAMNSKYRYIYIYIYRYISKVYKYNRQKYDEDREEFRTFRKKYEIDCEKRKESDDTSFREDIRSLVQQVFKLERDLNDNQKSTKTIKHNAPQILPESYQRNSIVQHKIINRPNTLSLENDMPTDPIRQLTLRDILFAILIFDGYNVPITQFINECHEVQNTVFPQEEANIIILLRSKLHGRARKALHYRQFTNIKQFTMLYIRMQIIPSLDSELAIPMIDH